MPDYNELRRPKSELRKRKRREWQLAKVKSRLQYILKNVKNII